MKFITEDELRDLYRKQPFTDYDLKEGERLTPGARQFLLDRGIDMYDRNDPYANLSAVAGSDGKVTQMRPKGQLKNEKFQAHFKVLKADFLLTAKDLMATDVCTAQHLNGLYRYFAETASPEHNGKLVCTACSGICDENFSCCIGDCFEITDFHMQMENGREILLLDRLRSKLQMFNAGLGEYIDQADMRICMSEKLNQVINTISQMICTMTGGKECQRKK